MNSVFKALADPTRRKILEMLRKGDMTAGDIAGQFAIGNSSISHHLAILKTAELVQASRNGQTIVYSLNTTVFQEIMGWLLEFGEHEKTTN